MIVYNAWAGIRNTAVHNKLFSTLNNAWAGILNAAVPKP